MVTLLCLLCCGRDHVCDAATYPPTRLPHLLPIHMPAPARLPAPARTAIMGGVLAGDMIKTISQKDTPFDNFLFFDGPTMEGG